MVKPLKMHDQLKSTHFVQDKTLAVYFGMSHFDKVLKKNKEGLLVPDLSDLEAAKKDCLDLMKCLERY